MPQNSPEVPPDVSAVFHAMPDAIRLRLMEARDLIYSEAAQDPRIGPLTETLKWGQPSYLTQVTKAGTTIRLGAHSEDQGALFVHCQTTLAEEIREACGDALTIDGNRAIVLPSDGPLPEDALRLSIRAALTYHARKKA